MADLRHPSGAETGRTARTISRRPQPLPRPTARNTMNSLPGTRLPNPGDRSDNATARKHQMHGIRAVRR